ncbi:MAG: glycosyltransferase [Magnetococcales bacterium]|nr:glycosyltransferase [Magnetococcales bacterium]
MSSQPDKKNVLMIAYHFPPARGSGVQRTLSFCQNLPDFGWQPQILSVNPRAYPSQGDDQLKEIPPQVNVERAFTLDAAKDLAIKGKYLGITAVPDRFSSWWLWAVPKAMEMIKKTRPDVIWATYPIATSLLIAHSIHKKTGIPWIADFRDPMFYNSQAEDSLTKKVYAKIEKQTIESCQKIITTTQGHSQLYQQKYSHLNKNHWQVIPNGYDEGIFKKVEKNRAILEQNPVKQQITILHSGTLYKGHENRTPQPLFAAIAKLKQTQKITATNLKIIFRATGCDKIIQNMITKADIADIVEIKPAIPYEKAIEELINVDGLLLLQGKNYNHQVPAKLYEYIRAKKPFLALTDPQGDTANIMHNAGINTISPLHDEEKIVNAFMGLISSIITKTPNIAKQDTINKFSRFNGTKELAMVLDEIVV